MTVGHRDLWRLAGPLILSNLTVPLLGAVDTAVVGHLEAPRYLGGVAVGALIFSFVYWGFGFLRMGTTGLAAQAHGAGDADEMRATLGRALLLAAAMAALLLALQHPIGGIALALVGAAPDVTGEAAVYFTIRIWSAPATFANYALLGWLLGMQNARAPLILLVFVNGLNILLDLLFVVGLGMTVDGVALATVIADYAGAALGLRLVHVQLRRYGGRWRGALLHDGAKLRRLLAVNADIFIRTLCLIGAFAFFTAQGARLGTATLAANAVLMNFQTFMAYGLDGFAHAAEALVGRALGAGDRAMFRDTVRISLRWALLTAAGFALLYVALGPLLVRALTSIAAVQAIAFAALPWMAASPLVSVWSYVLDGIFIGATRTAAMRNMMIVSLLLFIAPALLVVPRWGNDGLWLAFLLFMAVRGATLGAVFARIERRGGFTG